VRGHDQFERRLLGQQRQLAVVGPRPASYTSVSDGTVHGVRGSRTDATIACWGNDFYGQTTVPPGSYTSVSAGGYHTWRGPHQCDRRPAWGHDAFGQSTPPAGSYTPPSAPAVYHTCAVKDPTATVACWGNKHRRGVDGPPAAAFSRDHSTPHPPPPPPPAADRRGPHELAQEAWRVSQTGRFTYTFYATPGTHVQREAREHEEAQDRRHADKTLKLASKIAHRAPPTARSRLKLKLSAKKPQQPSNAPIA